MLLLSIKRYKQQVHTRHFCHFALECDALRCVNPEKENPFRLVRIQGRGGGCVVVTLEGLTSCIKES